MTARIEGVQELKSQLRGFRVDLERGPTSKRLREKVGRVYETSFAKAAPKDTRRLARGFEYIDLGSRGFIINYVPYVRYAGRIRHRMYIVKQLQSPANAVEARRVGIQVINERISRL